MENGHAGVDGSVADGTLVDSAAEVGGQQKHESLIADRLI